MEGSHQGNSNGKAKVARHYALWTPKESNELLRLMVDAIQNGWCGSRGGLSKITVEKKILPRLNEKFGCQRSYAHYQSRLKWLRTRFQKLSKFKAHPTHKNLIDTIADYEDLAIVFGNTSIAHKNSIGSLNDDTNVRTYDVKEDKQYKVDGLPFEFGNDGLILNDVHVASQDLPRSQYTPSIPQETKDATSTNYSKKKRNRTECDVNNSLVEEKSRINNVLDKLSICLDSIAAYFNSLIQKREKESSCWDAIKEVRDLDSNTRFQAIEWLNTREKRYMFLTMSPQERYNWIMFKLSK